MKYKLLTLALAMTVAGMAQVRQETNLDKWDFSHNGSTWEQVDVPHDWAISGPFDKKWDLQVTQIKENGETHASEHSGRSGALPWIGKGIYKTPKAIGTPKSTSTEQWQSQPYMSTARMQAIGHMATALSAST